MLTNDNLFDSAFQGSVAESRARLPEGVVDAVVNALALNPDEIVPDGHQGTIKEQIWDWLVFLVTRYGGPSPTQTGTTPKQLQKRALDHKKALQQALATLRSMTYEAVFESSGNRNDFVIAHGIRLYSRPQDKPRIAYGEGAAKYEKERTGVWPELYPFDKELPQAIASLEKIASYLDPMLAELSGSIKGRGKQKDGKDKSDALICGLCDLYKYFTGKAPVTSPKENGKATGRIIPLLQAVLPITAYAGETTDWALQQKVDRLKTAGKIS